MKSFNYNQCNQHHTLFYIPNNENKIVLVLVYVEDIVVTRNDEEELSNLKERFFQAFHMKYFGILSNFLGMEVTYLEDNICLS